MKNQAEIKKDDFLKMFQHTREGDAYRGIFAYRIAADREQIEAITKKTWKRADGHDFDMIVTSNGTTFFDDGCSIKMLTGPYGLI
jgi:hypothetical protein